MSRTPGTSARAWIDGASRGNPGDAGFGALIEIDGEAHEILGFLGQTTNNVAEYAALIAALSFAAREGLERIDLLSDSQLLVRQLEGEYKVKASHLQPIFMQALKLRRAIPKVTIRHIQRTENREADRLANQAIDQRVASPEWLELKLPAR